MERRLNHGEVRDLLGAYALDAVDDDERAAVEQHLGECRPCQAEVGEHREVASLLAAGFVPAPEGVWDRIAGSLEEAPPPMGLAPVVQLDSRRPRRWSVGGIAAAMVAGIAVASSVAVVGVNVLDTRQKVDDVAASLRGDDLGRVAAAAAADPGARQVAMRSTDGRLRADAVLLPDGTGYLVRDNLPQLPAGKSYQLWSVVGGSKISVGVLGGTGGPVAFHASGDVAALAITEEQAGGVIVSQQQPTVLGTVSPPQ